MGCADVCVCVDMGVVLLCKGGVKLGHIKSLKENGEDYGKVICRSRQCVVYLSISRGIGKHT